MADLSQIIDDIRSLVSAGVLVNSSQMQHLASEFAELSRPITDRLRRCDEYLQKGLRSEALHLAQAEPELLDAVSQLDFPGRDDWESAVLMYGLARAPKPSPTSAAALNRAYAEEEPLRPFLIQHRLLALSRAPYLQRMNLLRQMLEIEPGNIAFQEDLAKFEPSRVVILQQEFALARSTNDPVKILDLLREVDQTFWVNPPPKKMVQEIRALGAQKHQETLLMTAKALGAHLTAAYQRKDESTCRNLLTEFQEIANQLGWHLADNPAIRLQPLIDWLAKQDGKRASEFELEVALGELDTLVANPQAKEADLAKAMDKATTLGTVPASIQDNWTAKYETLQTTRVRKEYLILGITLAAGVLALVTFFVVVVMRRRS